jgi:hypothetical protein
MELELKMETNCSESSSGSASLDKVEVYMYTFPLSKLLLFIIQVAPRWRLSKHVGKSRAPFWYALACHW